jgi:hypothetical protein
LNAAEKDHPEISEVCAAPAEAAGAMGHSGGVVCGFGVGASAD